MKCNSHFHHSEQFPVVCFYSESSQALSGFTGCEYSQIFIQHLAGFCFWEQALFCVFTAGTPFPISSLSTSQLHLLLQFWAYEDTVMQHKLIFERLRLSKQSKTLAKSFAKYSDENKEFYCSTIDHSMHKLFQVRKTRHSFSHDCLGGFNSCQSWVPMTSVGLWGFNFHVSETRLWILLGGTIKVLPKKKCTYLPEMDLVDKEIFAFLIWNSHTFFLSIPYSAGEIVSYLFEYWRKIKGTSRHFIAFDAV